MKGKAGSLGDVGGFSFDAEKHLTADHGGAVTTDDKDIADKVRSFALTRGAVTVSELRSQARIVRPELSLRSVPGGAGVGRA